MPNLRAPALLLLLLATPALAQLSSITAGQLEPDVLILDFNSLPDGPIAATDPAFHSINVTNVALIPTFSPGGDDLDTNPGDSALCSRQNVLTVSAPLGMIDNPQGGGGNGWHFDILGGTATQVGFSVKDESGAPVIIQVFSGATPLGSSSWSSSAGALRLFESSQVFDAFEIRANGSAGGWAIDDLHVAGFGPRCVLGAPLPASTVSATVTITHDATHTTSLPVDASYECSTDLGLTWTMCTEFGGGPNPVLGIPTPTSGLTFAWDSIADGVGLAMVQATEVRVSVTDAVRTSTCTVSVDVDNVIPGATCTLTLQSSTPVGGVGNVELTADSPNVGVVDATFSFSTDGGATFTQATPGPASTNPLAGVPILTPTIFGWDSYADGVGQSSLVSGVLVRATVDDLVAPLPGECITPAFDVDNTALCNGLCGDCNEDGLGPGIIDALVAAQISAGLLIPSTAQTGCCDINASLTITILDALGIAQVAAGLPGVLTCP